MKAAQDFNYKVALASGLRELQAGRLRQAEEQFRYLCAKFPTADGGYRGLAKVLSELEDRAGALAALRDGASKLARAGEHAAVIALLNEAVELDPTDVAAHRRLASAHALAGATDAAAGEYARYADAVAGRDDDAARRETRYGLETLGPHPTLVALARRLGVDAAAPAAPAPRPATSGPAAASAAVSDDDLRLGAIPGLPRRRRAEPSAAGGPDLPLIESFAAAPSPAEPAAAAPLEAIDDPMAADLRAAEYIANKDPRAAQAALVAARHFIADGRTNAASDLLLQLIASGLADHDAQRLLVEVVSSIGKRDVARAKCALLAEALRLDGQPELAVEVERLAQAV